MNTNKSVPLQKKIQFSASDIWKHHGVEKSKVSLSKNSFYMDWDI